MQKNVRVAVSAIIGAVGTSILLFGCSSPPDCDATETKNLVYEIVNRELKGIPLLTNSEPIPDTFRLEAIRLKERNTETKAYKCAATIKYKVKGIDKIIYDKAKEITYTVEQTTSGDEIYVSVYGRFF